MTTSEELPTFLHELPQVLNLERHIETTVATALSPEGSYQTRATADEVARLVEELPDIEKGIMEVRISELSCNALAKALEERHHRSEHDTLRTLGRHALDEVPAVSYWKKFYLEPRTVPAGPEEYADWAETRLILDPDVRIINRLDRLSSHKPLLKGLQDIELQPLAGSDANFGLIVPPNVNVTGRPGHIDVYRWETIADDTSRLSIYHDTAAMINARGSTSVQ